MGLFENLKPWLGRKSVRGVIALTFLIVLAIILLLDSAETQIDEGVSDLPIVSVITANEFAGGQSLSLIGNVRASTEASITSERAGRVTSVPVTLGQTVAAGQVIATLENASERAAVLQAEGVYDAAVAATAQSGVGVQEAQNAVRNAQNAAVSAFRSAYNSTNGVVVNSVDSFFSAPNSAVPGLRIDGRGFTPLLNSERVAYQTILPTWQARVNSISIDSDLQLELEYAKEATQRTLSLVDTFLTVFSQQNNSNRYTEAELQTFSTNFTNLRATLIATQTNLDSALTGLQSANDGLKRAQLAAAGGTTSAADAQVKQALGALRSAQANLAKTVLRTPISGTINSLDVRTGDFVNSFAEVAQVANNNALEIITFLSDSEKSQLAVGDEVIIENEFTGVVTKIAPAVDSATRKTEVRISAENIEIASGETVRVAKEIKPSNTKTIFVPLSAVKFNLDDGFLLIINDGVLETKQVTLGTILGGTVEVVDGLAADEPFVVDVRGLQSGVKVSVTE